MKGTERISAPTICAKGRHSHPEGFGTVRVYLNAYSAENGIIVTDYSDRNSPNGTEILNIGPSIDDEFVFTSDQIPIPTNGNFSIKITSNEKYKTIRNGRQKSDSFSLKVSLNVWQKVSYKQKFLFGVIPISKKESTGTGTQNPYLPGAPVSSKTRTMGAVKYSLFGK